MCFLLHLQDGCTPLMVHAELGNVVVVTCLIERNALLDAQDKVCIVHSFTGPLIQANFINL